MKMISLPTARCACGRPALLVASLSVLLAGCGGSSNTGVAQLSTGHSNTSGSAESGGPPAESRASAQGKIVAYAQCMRSHGVSSFPEPVEGRIRIVPSSGIDPGSAQFQAADGACRSLLPGGGKGGKGQQTEAERQQQVKDKVAFAGCMRSHGVPTFPDPNSEGELKLATVRAAGIDVHSPMVQAAAQTCLPAAGGALTESELKRAEHGGS
jgi:hypothetical protein